MTQELLGWPFSLFYSAFLITGIFTGVMIPFCYVPNHAAALLGQIGPLILEFPLVKLATLDRSAASLACFTLTFLTLARYYLLWNRRQIQEELLERFRDELQRSGRELQTLSRVLPEPDPVGRYLRLMYTTNNARQEKGGTADGALELLHRGLMREDTSFRQMVTPLVVLGLLGTLISVPIGFLLTFGAEQELQLHTALQQAVVVVATACLSSVWGVGLGQLLIEPLANQLGRKTGEVVDRAIEVEGLL